VLTYIKIFAPRWETFCLTRRIDEMKGTAEPCEMTAETEAAVITLWRGIDLIGISNSTPALAGEYPLSIQAQFHHLAAFAAQDRYEIYLQGQQLTITLR